MITVWPSESFREGRWLNGMGVSWDIATSPPEAGALNFDWRFAIARIDTDAPFSRYESVDRVFMVLEGDGVALEFSGLPRIVADRAFVPHSFPGDVPTQCRLRNGPCHALNLFLARGRWQSEVEIVSGQGRVPSCTTCLIFALDGEVCLENQKLRRGDAAQTQYPCTYDAGSGHLYVARLSHTK